MQVSAPSHRPPLTASLIRAGWLLLPFWLGAMFTFSLSRQTASLIIAQVVFLLPLTVAMGWLVAVSMKGPRTVERSGWRLLTVATGFVWAAELYFSAYQLFADPAGPPTFGPYDVFNLIGACLFVGGLTITAGLGRVRKADTLRMVADIVALLVVIYMALYHYWVRDIAGAVPWWESARWTAYSFVGLVMITLVGLSYRNLSPIRSRSVVLSLGVSLLIFSAGLVMWPVWQSGSSVGGPSVESAVITTILMLGYYLLCMSALSRYAERDLSWRDSVSRLEIAGPIWPATALSAVVLIAVWLMGLWAYEAPEGSGVAALYVAAAVTATLALVARTGFASIEAGEWRSTSALDPVTGALNHSSFHELCEDRVRAAGRGETFSVALLDVDAFSRINRVLGHAAGDAMLRAIADSLRTELEPEASVCRLSGDEFAVIAPGVGKASALRLGRRVLSAVHHVEVPQGPGLSASVGVATCAGHCDRADLLRQAEAAQAWAKYHGKNRAVVYDGHMVRALDVEERLRIRERESHMGIARALASAVDARDSRNYYHSRNVAAMVALVCEELRFDEERARLIETAAILHDVGKIALPDDVLKAQQPSPRQVRLAREHVTLGETLVESLGEPGIPQWVRGHHERWDGAGYPDGLSGADIPLEARIISLADAYDTMTSGQRTGRQLSKAAALQEVDHGIGSRFDPELAETFIQVVGTTPSLGWLDEGVES